MTSTVFSSGTVITAPWLNDVNTTTYTTVPAQAVSTASNAAAIAVINGATGSNSVGYTPAGVGHTLTTVQAKLRESISVKDFGCVGDGVTNDTANFQEAITAAENAGASLYIPDGIYKTTATLTITKRLHLYGEGAKVSIISSSALEALLVATPVGYANTFSYFHDFGIDPAVAGGGTSGFVCRLAAAGANYAYMSNFIIERVYIGDFSSYGMVFDNNVANTDGFSTFTVRRCWISNGLNLNKIGDSCNIEENTITDGATVRTNHTGNRVGVLYTGLSGARQGVLRSNNITTSGGAIAAIYSEQIRIQDNYCEHPYNYQIPYGASGLTYNAHIYLNNCTNPEIVGNTISPGNLGSAVTTGTTVSGNGTITSIASMTNIYAGCTVSGTGITPGTRVGSVGPGSQVNLTLVATSSGVGTTLTFGYAPDYSVSVSGTTSYGNFSGNSVDKATLYHFNFSGGVGVPAMFLGEANTFQSAPNVLVPVVNNPNGNINAKMLPHVTTSTLPTASSFPGGVVWDETSVTAKISDGTSWTSLGATSGPTMTSLFFNPFFDIYGNTDPAVGPPLGVTAAGSAIKETSAPYIYSGSTGTTSMKVLSSGATITNGVVITPGLQPWRNSTESISISVAVYSTSFVNGAAKVFLFDGTTYWPMGQSTVNNTWQLIKGTHTLVAGSNWSIVIASWSEGTSAFTSGYNFYVGGVNVVRGTVAPDTIEDTTSRRNYVIQETVAPLYAPAFIGMRYLNSTLGKFYMAKGQAVVGDWIILN